MPAIKQNNNYSYVFSEAQILGGESYTCQCWRIVTELKTSGRSPKNKAISRKNHLQCTIKCKTTYHACDNHNVGSKTIVNKEFVEGSLSICLGPLVPPVR